MSVGAVWEVSAHAGRAGQSYLLGGTLGENSSASWRKTNVGMAYQRVGAASWASSMFSLTLVVNLCAVGACVGSRLRQFYDEQPLVQEQLATFHGHALACPHLTPGQCVQHWDIVRGTGLAVTVCPMFLPPPYRRLCRRCLAIV